MSLLVRLFAAVCYWGCGPSWSFPATRRIRGGWRRVACGCRSLARDARQVFSVAGTATHAAVLTLRRGDSRVLDLPGYSGGGTRETSRKLRSLLERSLGVSARAKHVTFRHGLRCRGLKSPLSSDGNGSGASTGSTMEEVAKFQQQFGEVSAAIAALRRHNAKLKDDLRQVTAEDDAILIDIDALKSQIALFDKECEMISQKIERTKQQIVMFDSIVLPQQHAELASLIELEETKKEKYKLMIEKHENVWKRYEVIYNKFPRVAERNALQKEVELLKTELLKKRQLVVEKAKQAEQIQAIKAQRVEILRAQFLEEFAKEQNIRRECENLDLQIKEIKARVLEKEALKLEEEKRRQQELQQVSQSESDNNQSEVVLAEQPAIPRFTIPKFNMPVFDLDITMPGASSQFQPLPMSPVVPLAAMSFSQPARLSTTSFDLRTPKPAEPPVQAKTMPPGMQRRDEINFDFSKHYQKESQSENSLAKNVNSTEPAKKGPPSATILRTQEEPIVTLTINKKESILSTDNIAAKMKESSRSNAHSLDSPIKPPVKVCGTQASVSSSQEGTEGNPPTSSADPSAEDTNVDPSDMLATENEGTHAPESAVKDTNIFSCDSAENGVSPTEDDNGYDFNPEEYGEDYGSPPPFEVVMSPVHAHFESPTSLEEDTPDDGAFSGLSFFSKAATNIFGGQSTSGDTAREKEKSTSSFPFFF